MACSLCVQELIGCHICLPKDCSERSFRHVAGMVGNGGVFIAGWVKPDLMAAGSLAIELEAQLFEFFDDLPVFEACQPAHQVPRISG